MEEVVNPIGVGDRRGACDVCNWGEEDVESTEDQRVWVGGRIKEVTKGGMYHEGWKVFVNTKSARSIAEGRRHSDNEVGGGAGAGT